MPLTPYSIECVQASIDEVYDAWVNGKYPSYIAADGEITQGSNEFKALRIAPLPISYTVQKVSSHASIFSESCFDLL